MADVNMPESVPCKFDSMGWSPCRKPSDNGICSKHEGLKCVCCGKQALRSCYAQMGGMACGSPLCEDCQHGLYGGHVTGQVYEEQVREETEFLKTGKESKIMLALRGVPTDVELPCNLKELLELGREDFSLKNCYYLRIKHGCAGEFPAIVKNTRIMVITADKSSILRVWGSLFPENSEIVTSAWLVNDKIGVGYYMAGGVVEQEQSRPYKIFSVGEVIEYFAKEEEPFRWAPGLIGARISQQQFEQLIKKELVV